MPHFGRPGHGTYLIELRNMMMEVAGLRRFGAAALDLAYVAAGRTDGYWEDNLQICNRTPRIQIVHKTITNDQAPINP
ncbi:extragenic suppressor protein SuhB [Bartonella tribocorum]|uniref:Inositol-1-monophosphatase family protein n=1 Tax=Bartonella tribocorum (strain DSM 28219 / CCUG 45778 / CIP 105476 / IBS 506) TaxID=382640 RepID=A9IYP6_BART1|nr:Inositol-1-monophosphatase family protein [Bartonella tribocorum CIP 105476]CDO49739.1 extragenic suppressor protein SuhB [Bartonella tribocorum]